MTRAPRLVAAVAVVVLSVAGGGCRGETKICGTSESGLQDDFATPKEAFDDYVADTDRPRDGWVVKEESAESVTYRREAGDDWQELRVRKLGARWRSARHDSCVTGARD